MSDSLFFSLLFLLGILISSFAQILLKSSAQMTHKNHLREYLNFRVIVSYAILFSVVVLSVYCYKVISLTTGVALSCVEYVFVAVLSYLVFKERFPLRKVFGLVLIVCGVLLYSLG